LLSIQTNSMRLYRPYRELPRGETVDRFRIGLSGKVPAYGYAVYTLERYTIENHGPLEYSAPKLVAPVRYPGSMQIDEHTWDNGRIQLRVCSNGTIQVTDDQTGRTYEGLLLLEDEADIGDGWSHIAPVNNEVVRSSGAQAVISTVYDGPYQACICIQINLRVPKGIKSDENSRSQEWVEMPITTWIELKKGDPIIYCRTKVQNTARNHRLRVLFPSGLTAEHYHTSTPFDFVKRQIERPDRSDYLRKDFDVVPHNGIVTVDDHKDGLAIYSKGLYEVVVRDNKQRTIALTLFRSTGKEVLSDGSDGGQLLRELEFSYAIRPFTIAEAHPAPLWKEHQQYVTGIRSMNRKAGKLYLETMQQGAVELPLSKSYLNLASDALIVSAFKPSEDQDNSYIIRLFNITEQDGSGTLTFEREIAKAELVNLDEAPMSELPITAREIHVTVLPKQILTVKVCLQS